MPESIEIIQPTSSTIVEVVAPSDTPSLDVVVPGQTQVITVSVPGIQGPAGDTGPANTLTIGTVTTGAAGSNASATITGTAPNQALNLTIPRGNTGSAGPANTLAIGTVTTGAAGSSATATITGTAPNQTLNLTIPQGQQGPVGAGAPDATTTTKGSIQLAGDLAGTAAAPTVPGLAGKANTTHTHVAADISNSTAVGRNLIIATDAATARSAIGAGTSSLVIGTTAGTAAAGNDSRLSDARNPLAHTHGVADLTATGTRSASTFLRGDNTWATVQAGISSVASTDITDATAIGRTILTSADAVAVRTAIGAGTSSLAIGTTSTTAMAGNKTFTAAEVGAAPASHTHTAANISDSTTVGRSVITAADAAAARTAIGAGTSNLAIGTTASTAMAGNKTFTKADVGLGSVDNTSDANKPVSTAQQTALNAKVTNGAGITEVRSITQAAYDALGTKVATTLYVIVG